MRWLALLALLAAYPAWAQPLKQSAWLPPGADIAGDIHERPREALDGGAAQTFYVELGRLAFRSPETLGGNARRAGLSCNACHPSGHTNPRFFVPGLSDVPGRIDVTNALWNHRGEDGVFNPLPIPTLRDVYKKARLGQDGRLASLREFARNVIVLEFAGDEPAPVILDALTAYLLKLRTPDDPSPQPVTLAGDVADLQRALAVLRTVLLDEDAALADLVIRMVRGEAGAIAERFSEAARQPLAAWTGGLRGVDTLAASRDFPAALRALAVMQASLPAAAAQLPLAGSLYRQ
jgi:hypothetical protein